MPRDGSGTYTQPPGTTAGPANTPISSSAQNTLITDISAALTDSLPVTGVKSMSAALGMGANKITNIGLATAPTDAASAQYVTNTELGWKNAVMNPSFRISKRGASFSGAAIATGSYTADRWGHTYDGTGATRSATVTGAAATPVPPNGNTSYYTYAKTVAGSGGSFDYLFQPIENVSTYNGQTVTLSFWASASSNYTLPEIKVGQYFGTGGSPSATVNTNVTTNVAVTNTATKFTYTFSIPSIVGKTLGSNSNDCLILYFGFPINSTFTTISLWDVQLELGSYATPFEVRSVAVEFDMCQRFCQRLYYSMQSPSNAAGMIQTIGLVGTMKATPTITVLAAGTLSNCTVNSESVGALLNTFIVQIIASANGGSVIGRQILLEAEPV